MTEWYGEDLAYIHDVGHGDFALGAAPGILGILDAERGTFTRRITSFRKVGEHYRRDDEVHRQRLYRPSEIAGELRRTGFRVRTMRAYGRYDLPRSHAAFVACKPG